ncbi:RNA polymerase sigma factor for flagellar operon (Sigma-F factor) [gamma proteobacterium HdN1]|nr:RNA polymerase sigma factor for flagellar operon (Sigma-F factor) [gamma proteobacterium HdN1]
MNLANRRPMYTEQAHASLDTLVEQHLPLVRRIAHHMIGRLPSNVIVDDLIQAGVIGLIDALQKYDTGKGASFETYAGIRIRGAMIDEIRRGEWAPRSVHRNARAIQDAIRNVEARVQRDATDREVAEELGVPLDAYHAMAQDSMATRLFSMEELTAPESIIDRGDLQQAHDNPASHFQRDMMLTSMANAIKDLPEREQLVLSLYYDEELNLKEIGEVLGVSESRVCQIHSQATHRLRARLRDWR